MIHIYVCEDNQRQLETICNTIKTILDFEELNMALSFASANPYALLKKLRENKTTGLYFLDIELQTTINGLNLAQQIRTFDPRGYIVFITTHSEKLTLTFQYKVEAMDFILKDQPDQITERIRQCILKAASINDTLQKQIDNFITIKIENASVKLNQNDIVLIESDSTPHKLIIHTRNGIKRISGSIKELEATLDSRFCRCHNSILVNTDHVSSFQREQRKLTLDNGETCPVSIRMLATIKRRLSI